MVYYIYDLPRVQTRPFGPMIWAISLDIVAFSSWLDEERIFYTNP
jgi:hypothetical protein